MKVTLSSADLHHLMLLYPELQNWNFFDLYANNPVQFGGAAQGAYRAACHLINPTNPAAGQKNRPTQAECCGRCRDNIMFIILFQNKAKHQFGTVQRLHDYAAELLARHILDKEWATIDNPGCP
jgi:hypothetical protein